MKKWYIKERHNPQFSNPYYVPQGQLTKKEVKIKERHVGYGDNYYLPFETRIEYENAIKDFLNKGLSVQENEHWIKK